jgi:hypothetical protein
MHEPVADTRTSVGELNAALLDTLKDNGRVVSFMNLQQNKAFPNASRRQQTGIGRAVSLSTGREPRVDDGSSADRYATELFVTSSMGSAAMLPAMIPTPPSRPTLCAPTLRPPTSLIAPRRAESFSASGMTAAETPSAVAKTSEKDFMVGNDRNERASREGTTTRGGPEQEAGGGASRDWTNNGRVGAGEARGEARRDMYETKGAAMGR